MPKELFLLKKVLLYSKKSIGNAGDRFLRSRKRRRRIVNMEKDGVKKRDKVILILGMKRSHSAKHLNLIKILVDSMNAFEEKQNVPESALPSRFRFEDEVVLPPHKSEHDKFIDELFHDLELGLRQIDCTDLHEAESDDLKTTVEIDGSCCYRGKHQAVLDEQIGLICKICDIVIMDIMHVLPPFHVPILEWRDKRYYRDEFQGSNFSDIQFEGTDSSTPSSTSCMKGTVWDLVPGVKEDLYPHQWEGFEFMWRNIAGDTKLEKLKQTLADDARWCIISHAPGTGKTRLTIVFLQSFLKLYLACSPLIIVPKGMLLTWEAEFKKWNFNVSFHNLIKKELSGKEHAVATEVLEEIESGVLSQDCCHDHISLVKESAAISRLKIINCLNTS
ncbi:SNF2 domain-containing protein CLASSY 4-like isoform X1 [Salvia splendens]|uniref:SNF2 domain-containing protein CLASSY 4-like isoform X1 n=1 Tax=Salvia splendens TaxID=180675 RepID=UPI001C276E35|nr:SNF2 domain-containing protein CLASSY 4-like isoform X1 [Salvia splendens]